MEAQARALEAGLNIKPKYDYDSDEDTEGGTWEHKKRTMEMEATRGTFPSDMICIIFVHPYFLMVAVDWADKLTAMGTNKHFIGDFLPPEELEKFMETWNVNH